MSELVTEPATAPAKRTAVVTGASAGIGAATARALFDAGFHVVLGARRIDRLESLASELAGTAQELDVTDAESVARFVQQVPECHVLVNNAGGVLKPRAQYNVSRAYREP